jgi:hypothetical protein
MSDGLILAVMFSLAVATWIGWIWHECATATRLLSAKIRSALHEQGVVLQGNPFGSYSVEVNASGFMVRAKSAVSRKRPGTREDESSETVCLVELAFQTADFIVCRSSVVDAVMGPLPAVPRVRTGHAAFDAAYSVFAAPASIVATPGYRDAPVPTNIAWAQPAIVERLLELGLRWMRVREAQAEVTFDPLQPQDAVRAALTCVNIVRGAAGAGLMGVTPGARIQAPDTSGPLLLALFGVGAGLFLSVCVGLPVAGLFDLSLVETWLMSLATIAALGCAAATAALLRKGS